MLSPISTLWICVPTYNEAEGIETFLQRVVEMIDEQDIEAHVLVADDHSPDGTGQIVEQFSEHDSRVQIIHRDVKLGIGPAYIDAFKVALKAGAQVIVQMDSDLSHDPKAIPSMLSALDDADIVIGSRYVPGGTTVGWSLSRRIVSRAGCWYARQGLGVSVRDLTGGFKCFRRTALEALCSEEVSAFGYGFQIEMTHRALGSGLKVVEVPICFRERAIGRSKMSFSIMWEAAWLIVRLRRRMTPTEVTGQAEIGATSVSGESRAESRAGLGGQYH
jgi:dolichol-phosphate mannosyltransferase